MNTAPRPPMPGTPLWVIPMGFGSMVFILGILLWLNEDLLRFIVAATFCAFGLMLMAFAWKLRPRGGGGGGGGGGRTVEFRVEREPPS